MILEGTNRYSETEWAIFKRVWSENGLRLGDDPLAPVLFNIALEYVVRKAVNRNVLLHYNKHQILAFSEDTVIMTWSKEEIENKQLEVVAHIISRKIK